MKNQHVHPVLLLTGIMCTFFAVQPVNAADIIIEPAAGQPYGAHEIWANGEIGQSFIAQAADVKAGMLVTYSPESAAVMAPNAPITQIYAKLYEGEGIDNAKLLHTTVFTVDTTQQGFLDVDYAASGIQLVPGNKYTLGITSPYNRGWLSPSVCDYSNVSVQPTGMYTDGHPFLHGLIILDETGICDNAFHVLGTTPKPSPMTTPTPTPVPTIVTPTPIEKKEMKKVDKVGIITGLAGASIVVHKTIINITSDTVLKLNYKPALAVGMKINYKGYMQRDGSVLATFIEVK